MRISDWSSDVCSSDLSAKAMSWRSSAAARRPHAPSCLIATTRGWTSFGLMACSAPMRALARAMSSRFARPKLRDRKSVVYGQCLSVLVDLFFLLLLQNHTFFFFLFFFFFFFFF